MSNVIDNKIVEMQFDNAQFERNVATTLETLKKLNESLGFAGAANAIGSVGNAIKDISTAPVDAALDVTIQGFNRFASVADQVVRQLGQDIFNFLTTPLREVGNLLKGFTIDQIGAGFTKFSDKTTSVGTLVAQGNDLELVNDQLAKLNWFTDETSYNFVDMVSNISKFTATGQDLETSVVAMEGIANWAALSGQNAGTASRAMYQLSQAMGKGALKYDDYKSIQNASMDTQEFRQHCLDAAVALGQLNKTGEDTYQTLGGKSFSKGQFTEFLSDEKWLNTDVMMKVFQEYAGAVDDIYTYTQEHGGTASDAIEAMGGSIDEFGLKAFRAAQEARTWADVVDSVKDAVSTGWMNTFEIIFGNYDEAKSLFTDLANTLYDVFAGGAERRNEILSYWKEFEGRDALINGISNAFEGLNGIITLVTDAFRQFWPQLDSDVVGKNLANATKGFEQLTAGFRDLFGIEEITEGADKITEFTETVNKEIPETGTVVTKTLEEIEEVANRVIAGDFGNDHEVRKAQLEELGFSYAIVQNKVNELMGSEYRHALSEEEEAQMIALTTGNLEELSESAVEASDGTELVSDSSEDAITKIRPLSKYGENLRNTFSGLFSIFNFVGNSLKELAKAMKPVTSLVKDLAVATFNWISDSLGEFGLWVSETLAAVQASEEFHTVFSAIGNVAQFVANVIRDNLNPVLDLARTLFQNVAYAVSPVTNALRSIGSGILEKIYGGFASLAGLDLDSSRGGITEFIKGITESLSSTDIFEQIHDKLEVAVARLSEVFANFPTNAVELIERLKEGFSSAAEAVKRFVDNTVALGGGIPGLFDAGKNIISGFIDGILESGGSVWERVVSIFSGFVQRVKDFFGIHSPSTVFIEIGKNIVEGLKEGLLALGSNPFEFLINVFKAASDIIGKLAGSIIIIVANFINDLVNNFNSMKNSSGEGTSLFETIANVFKSLVDKVVEAVNKLKSSAAVEEIKIFGQSLGEFAQKAIEFLKNVDWEKVVYMIKDVANAFLAFAAGKTLLTFQSTLKDLGESFEKFGKSISAGFGSIRSGLSASTILKIAAAILALAGAVKILSGIDSDDAGAALGTLFVSLLSMTAILKVLTLIKADSLNASAFALVEVSASLLIVAFAIEKLADVVVKLSEIPAEKIADGFSRVLAILIGFVAYAALMHTFGDNALSASAALVLLNVGLSGMLATITLYSFMPWETLLDGITKLGVTIVALGIATKAIPESLCIKAAAALTILAGGLGIFGNVIVEYSKMSIETFVGGLGGIAVGILGLAGVSAIASLATGPMIALAGALITLSGALLAIEGVIWIFGVLTGSLDMSHVIDSFMAKWDAFEKWVAGLDLNKIMENIVNWFLNFIPGIREWIGVEEDATLSQVGEALIGKIKEGIDKVIGTRWDAAANVINSFLEGIGFSLRVPNWAAISSAVSEFLSNLGQKIFGENGLFETGKNLVASVIDGILGALSELWQTISSIWKTSEDQSKSELGIQSPSTVFMEIGKNIVLGLIAGIQGLFTTVVDLIKGLVLSLVAAVVEKYESFKTAASTIIGKIVEGFSAFINDPVGTIATLITNCILAITTKFDEFKTNAGTVISNIKSGFEEFISDPQGTITTLMTDCVGEITGKFNDFKTNAGTIISNIQNGFTEFITTNDPEGTMTTLMTNCVGAISGKFAEFKTNAGTVISNIKSGFTEIITSDDPVGEITTLLGNAVSVISEKFGEFKTNAGTAITNIKNGFTEIVTSDDPAGVIREMVNDGIKAFSSKFATFKTNAGTVISKIKSGLSDSLGTDDPLGVITGFLDNCITSFTERFPQFKLCGNTIFSNTEDGLAEDSPNALLVVTNFISDGLSAFTDNFDNFKTNAGDVISNVKNGLDEIMESDDPLGVITGFVDDGIKAFTDKQEMFLIKGKTIVTKVKTGITDKLEEAKAKGVEILSNIISCFSGTEFVNSLLSIGSSIVQGIIDGILSMGSQLVADITTFITNNIPGPICDILGIASPSKVTRQLGIYVGEGLALGIGDTADDVNDASTSLGDEMLDGLNKSLEDAVAFVDSDMDFRPTISPVLDLESLRNDAKGVNDLFSDPTLGMARSNQFAFEQSSAAKIQNDTLASNREIVSAINTLKDVTETMYSKLANIKMVLDTGALVGQIIEPIDDALGIQAIYAERGI